MTGQPVNSELLDQMPPVNLEAEKGVLGSLLLDANKCDEVGVIIRADDFHAEANAKLFKHLMAMHEEGKRVDGLLLKEWLTREGDFEAIGGSAYLAEVTQSVPYAANAVYYAEIVRDKATLRRFVSAGVQIVRLAYDPAVTPKDLTVQADTLINEAAGPALTSTTGVREAILKVFDEIDELETRGHGRGLSIGLADVDRYQGGFFGSELVILAARPRMGKTSLAIQVAMHFATRGRHVLFASLEQTDTELVNRALCQQAGVDSNRIRTGTLDSNEKKAMVEASGQLTDASLEIVNPVGGLSISDIRRLARQQKRKNNLQLLIIDYLQLIEAENPRDSREQQVAKMTRRLKALARELEIPVLCLAQLNREVEKAKGSHRPALGNLRESGAIEQDADVVLLIHREEVYTKDPDDHGQALLICAKNRNGPTRDYHLSWDAPTTTFRTPARLPDDDWEPGEVEAGKMKPDEQQSLKL